MWKAHPHFLGASFFLTVSTTGMSCSSTAFSDTHFLPFEIRPYVAPSFQKPALSTSVSGSELIFVSLDTSLSLSFPLCRMGISIEPISQGCCEDLDSMYI